MLCHTAVLTALAVTVLIGQDKTQNASVNREVHGRIVVEGGVFVGRAEVSFDEPVGHRFAVVRPKEGTFAVTLAEGEWRAHVKVETDAYEVVSIRAGASDLLVEPVRITDAGSPEIIVTMAATRPRVRVSGRARNEPGQPSVSRVSLTDRFVTIETAADSNGSFEFTQVALSNYWVRTPFDNFDTSIVVDREITDVDLRQKWEIKARVTTADGSPVPEHFTLLLHRLSALDSPGKDIGPYYPAPEFYMNVPQGEYSVEVVGLPGTYRIRSMTYGRLNLLRNTLKVSGPSGVDEFQLELEAKRKPKFVRVSGRVVVPKDVLSVGVSLTGSGWSYDVVADSDGRFEFPKVLSGSYFLLAFPGKARKPLTVGNKDIHNVNIELIPPTMRQVRGRVVVEGDYPLPSAQYQATAYKIQPDPSYGVTTQPDGTFVMNVAEGEHRLAVTGFSAPYRIRSIRYGNADLLKEPLGVIGENKDEILVTYEVTPSTWLKVAGRIIGTENLPAGNNPVYATLRGELTPIVLQTGSNTEGFFEFPKVLAGAYTLSTEPDIAGVTSQTIVVSDRELSGLNIVVPPQRQVVVRTVTTGTSSTVGYNLHVKYADGKGYEILRFANVDVAVVMGRTDNRCISDFCSNVGRLGLALQEPVVVSTSGQVLTLRLPEGEYRFEVQSSQHQVRSIQYGAADLFTEPLRIQGPEPHEVVVTFDP